MAYQRVRYNRVHVKPAPVGVTLSTLSFLLEEQRDEADNDVWRLEVKSHLATLGRLQQIAPEIEAILESQGITL